MLPFGSTRNQVVNSIIQLKKKYHKFIVNAIPQSALMKGSWGGLGTTPVDCPSWAILSLDHMQGQATMLHRERRRKEHEARMPGVRAWMLFHPCGTVD